MVITTYNKTQAMTGVPKAVTRNLSERVGRLYIAYVIDVPPFKNIVTICTHQNSKELPLSVFTFEKQGVKWKSTRISRYMSDWSERILKTRLSLSTYRQLAIAIDQTHVRSNWEAKDPGPSEGNTHSLQAGHTAAVEKHHHGISIEMIQGFTHQTLFHFREASKKWHRFGNLDEDMGFS